MTFCLACMKFKPDYCPAGGTWCADRQIVVPANVIKKETKLAKFTFATRGEGFDNHIDASVRGYSDLWNDVLKLSEYFVEDGTTTYDLGCSTGKLLLAMYEQNKSFAPEAFYQGIEIEEDFQDGLKEIERDHDWVSFIYEDAAEVDFFNTNFVTSIFTLQFMKPSDRRKTLRRIYDGLNDGGALVIAEKTIAADAKIQEIRTFMHYDHKRKSFDDEDILNKEVELRHMMKPNSREELDNMLREAGFYRIDSFWQNHAFTGFIALK